MKRVLVTGGAGFIGSNFIRALLRADERVQVWTLDSLTYAGDMANLVDLPDAARHSFIEGDVCDDGLVTEVLGDHRIETVVHFAAETHVDRSIDGPFSFLRTNVMGTLSLLEACRRLWLDQLGWGAGQCRFHHISTDEVYGSLQAGEPSFTEITPYAPNSPYAASKAAADHLVRSFVHTYRLPATLSSCSNNYGPFQYPEKLFPLVILNALNGIPIPIYGDGRQIRDWLYVEDHAEALLLLLAKASIGESYNISGGVQITNLEVVGQICDLLDMMLPSSPHIPHRSLIEFVGDRPGHDRRYAMDAGKIRRELGWQPRTSLDEGLRRTIRWYLDRPDWVETIRSKPEYHAWMLKNYATRGVAT